MQLTPIAYFRSAFPTKFGIPRQSGIVKDLEGRIVFEPAFRNSEALRGLDGFDYLWMIWAFSANRYVGEQPARQWQPTVRPPLLGGNTSMGVFATRSPYRPNPIGLSSARIERIEYDTPEGPQIVVSGADLMDGTPIFDIKPYLTYTDSHPEARSGFVDTHAWPSVPVVYPDDLKELFTPKQLTALIEVLRLNPRPSYQNDPHKHYGMRYLDYDIHFHVETEGTLVVERAEKLKS